MLLPSGNPFKCHEEVFVFAAYESRLNVVTYFPRTGGYSEGLDDFFKNIQIDINNGFAEPSDVLTARLAHNK